MGQAVPTPWGKVEQGPTAAVLGRGVEGERAVVTHVRITAPHRTPSSPNCSRMNFPNREEFSLRRVLALPKACQGGAEV